MAEQSVARLNSVLGLEKVTQEPYKSSIKPVEKMQWDELRFSSGGSALETEKSDQEFKTATSTILQKFAQTVCSTFSRSGWSVVRSVSLAKEGASKKRPSQHLHKVSTRSNKVIPRSFQTALLSSVEKNRSRNPPIKVLLTCTCTKRFSSWIFVSVYYSNA
jgi:hypothetical protein